MSAKKDRKKVDLSKYIDDNIRNFDVLTSRKRSSLDHKENTNSTTSSQSTTTKFSIEVVEPAEPVESANGSAAAVKDKYIVQKDLKESDKAVGSRSSRGKLNLLKPSSVSVSNNDEDDAIPGIRSKPKRVSFIGGEESAVGAVVLPAAASKGKSPRKQNLEKSEQAQSQQHDQSAQSSVRSLNTNSGSMGHTAQLSATSASSSTTGILSDPTRLIELNGRHYIRLNILGKGGSSSVYRIIGADDGHVYAYKRVEVKDCEDVDAVFDNYANEIALLRKLSAAANEASVHGSSQSRIIELIDCEVRRDCNYIAMVLEAGDIDLAKVLTQKNARANSVVPEGASPQSLLDPFFARMVWKEMLEAVDHIHTHRIVHGDLKPANFVFVKGHLKLIDFGIAKSFSTDTTNIYRESQIGTINYMAPEAIAPMSAEDCEEGEGQKMRLGRASDIWSLGCILYQMIYGRPPFAALNTIQKLSAIPNPKHVIKYPEWGESDAIDSIKACLIHDPRQRCKIPGPAGLLEKPFLKVSSNRSASGNNDAPVVMVGNEHVHCIVDAVLDCLSNSAQAAVEKAQIAGKAKGVSTRNSRSSNRLTAEAMEAQKTAESVVRWIDQVDQEGVEKEVLNVVEKECKWKVCSLVTETSNRVASISAETTTKTRPSSSAIVPPAPTPIRSMRSASTPQSSAGLPPKVSAQLPVESPARQSSASKRKFSVSTPASGTRSATKRAARGELVNNVVDSHMFIDTTSATVGTPVSKKAATSVVQAVIDEPGPVETLMQQPKSSIVQANTWAPVSIAAIPSASTTSRPCNLATFTKTTSKLDNSLTPSGGTKAFNPKPAFLSNILGSGKLTSFLGPPVKGPVESVSSVPGNGSSSSSSSSTGNRVHRSPLKSLPATLQQQIQLTAARLNNVSADGSSKEDRAAKWIKPPPAEENNLHSSLERQLGQLRKLMHWDDPEENVTETVDGSFAFF